MWCHLPPHLLTLLNDALLLALRKALRKALLCALGEGLCNLLVKRPLRHLRHLHGQCESDRVVWGCEAAPLEPRHALLCQ